MPEQRPARASAAQPPHQQSNISHQTSPRFALTLIELLVVIVILTTLVAGVIPVLSPNNDTRKIREATRMLQTYIMRAQTEAARTGRPQGIAFRESSVGSGVALDAFRVEIPPPFAGFSEGSRVELLPFSQDNGDRVYLYGGGREERGLAGGNGGEKFDEKYYGAQLYGLRFVSTGQSSNQYDPFPPGMFRIGDLLDIGGRIYLVVDDRGKYDQPNQVAKRPGDWPEEKEFVEFLIPSDDPSEFSVHCIAVDSGQGSVLPEPSGQKFVLKRYQFLRQPARTAETPIQLPAGIAIDMQGSVAEGASIMNGFPTNRSMHVPVVDRPKADPPINPPPLPPLDTFAIMFSPTGSVSSVFFNGEELTSVSRIALLLGRVENGGLINTSDWSIATNATNDKLAELQSKINWLNLDSRWLSIVTSSGRAVASDNAFVDARQNIYVGSDDFETAEFQIEAAHHFAHEMRTSGAGK